MSKNAELAQFVLDKFSYSLGGLLDLGKMEKINILTEPIKQEFGFFDKEILDFINLLKNQHIVDAVVYQRIPLPADPDVLDFAYTCEVNISKLKDFIKKESQNNTVFDPVKSCIVYKLAELNIPKNSKQFYFCKKVYEYPVNEPVSWDVIYADMEGVMPEKEKWKVVYDAMTEINKKVRDKWSIDGLFKYERHEFLRTI